MLTLHGGEWLRKGKSQTKYRHLKQLSINMHKVLPIKQATSGQVASLGFRRRSNQLIGDGNLLVNASSRIGLSCLKHKKCRELIKCNCRKGCKAKCKCRSAALPCRELCFCSGKCSEPSNILDMHQLEALEDVPTKANYDTLSPSIGDMEVDVSFDPTAGECSTSTMDEPMDSLK
ncbi:hypothetical protein ElyMa_000379100 [Elysia marginata]|uniref:CRC domain-containing protein n=1 Tax=Elysia marginata TaxID=1093978 RepID=A0AAV4FGA4_9GAST|nr:hypothetical protein ElyMa_000379100 [Elysia marginata]